MILVWAYLLVSAVILALGVYYLARYMLGDRTAGFGGGRSAPKWFWPFIICFGLLGVLSSAPDLLFHQKGWFIDKIFWLLSKL